MNVLIVIVELKIAFAFHSFSEHWHPTLNGDKIPGDYMRTHVDEKFYFTCKESKHTFQNTICDVVYNS